MYRKRNRPYAVRVRLRLEERSATIKRMRETGRNGSGSLRRRRRRCVRATTTQTENCSASGTFNADIAPSFRHARDAIALSRANATSVRPMIRSECWCAVHVLDTTRFVVCAAIVSGAAPLDAAVAAAPGYGEFRPQGAPRRQIAHREVGRKRRTRGESGRRAEAAGVFRRMAARHARSRADAAGGVRAAAGKPRRVP